MKMENQDHLRYLFDFSKYFQQEFDWEKVLPSHMNLSSNNNSFFSYVEIYPKCDVYKNEDVLIVETELPGIKKEDVKIEIQKDFILLSGESKTLYPQKQYFLKERPNLNFQKKIALPFLVSNKGIQSTFLDGLLTIRLHILEADKIEIPIE